MPKSILGGHYGHRQRKFITFSIRLLPLMDNKSEPLKQGVKLKSLSFVAILTSISCCSLPSNAATFIDSPQISAVGATSSSHDHQDNNGRVNDPALDNFIYFRNDRARGNLGRARPKPWSNKEKTIILDSFKSVLVKAPGLLTNAAEGPRIGLRRASKLSQWRSTGSLRKEQVFNAIASSGAIVFSDRFFDSFSASQQERILVHELVHAADCGYRVSYSKDWVDFAQDRIDRLRTTKDSPLELDGDGWPLKEPPRNLAEGLAEYFTCYIFDKDFPANRDFRNRFAHLLLTPEPKYLSWNEQYVRGMSHYRARRYDKAILDLAAASEIYPLAAMPNYFLSGCYAHKKDKATALAFSKKTLECLQLAGVSPSEETAMMCSQMHANRLVDSGNYQEAKDLLDKLLILSPINRGALLKRALCYRKMGKSELAENDIAMADRIKSGEFNEHVPAEVSPTGEKN